MGIAKTVAQFIGIRATVLSRCQHVFRAQFTGKELLHLGHRHARITLDIYQALSRLGKPLDPVNTEEVPDSILNIVGIDILVNLKLLDALLKLSGICLLYTSDAADE